MHATPDGCSCGLRQPMMYNWNAVILRYCDGGSFSGNNETVTSMPAWGLRTLNYGTLNLSPSIA